ncbi:hypothetical protein ACER0A_002325 [Haloimpatiens sp. FM7315]|uniref:hypothetical protein n=1 Tax=Haloimpatiens sp. FM7315 TaxID=3298609 RepID=UPI0035A38291
MAISKNSRRVQFTLNSSKDKEKEIIKFLDGCIDTNAAIKEIIYSYIVSNCNTKLPQVTQIQVSQSKDKSLQVSNFDNNIVSDSDNKLLTMSNSEQQLPQVSELEQNELEELNKFL